MAVGAGNDDQRSHLVVCIHGMWGQPSHTSYIAEQLEHRGCVVLNSSCNAGVATYDGLALNARRLCLEIARFLKSRGEGVACDPDGDTTTPRLSSISFVGYTNTASPIRPRIVFSLDAVS